MIVAALQRKDLAVDDIYDSSHEQEQLALILENVYERVLKAVHEMVASAYPDVEAFRLDDPATRRMLLEAAERVVRIDTTTRNAIREMLMQGQARGYSTWELANGVPKDGFRGIEGLFKETWRNRGLTVARTEIANAQVQSARDRYLATGIVDRMQIVDGDDDTPCASRNGRVVPVTTRVDLNHPNCTLALIPMVAGR
jgi:hypothetical protein